MTETDFFLNHNCQTLTCTCQSSTYSPPESTHFFQRSGSILMPFSKKGLWLAAYPLPNSLDDGVVVRRSCGSFSTRSLSSLKHLHHSNTWVRERHSSPYCCWSLWWISADGTPSSKLFGSGYAANHMPFFEKGIRVLPERWKKCVDSGGEYVEDWHVQVSVWQLWF